MFLEPGDATSSFYQVFLKAREAKSSLCEMFLRVRKTETQFCNDFLRETIAGRPFLEITVTTRDRIGTEINQAGVRSVSGLGLAQPRSGLGWDSRGGFINCNFRLHFVLVSYWVHFG